MKPLLLFSLAFACFAQAPLSKTPATRAVEFEPDGTTQAEALARLMQESGVHVRVEPAVKLLTISGPEERVKEAEELFRRYYKAKPAAAAVTSRNVELTLHILLGKSGPAETIDVPAVLNPVLAQLKQVTTLGSFRNIETQVVRVRENETVETSGVLAWTDVPDKAAPIYQFRVQVRYPGSTIRLENLKFGTRVPYKINPDSSNSDYSFREVGLSSSFDIKPGQSVVVGKTNASAKDGALILILSARVVD